MPQIAVANYQHTDNYQSQLLLSLSQFTPKNLGICNSGAC